MGTKVSDLTTQAVFAWDDLMYSVDISEALDADKGKNATYEDIFEFGFTGAYSQVRISDTTTPAYYGEFLVNSSPAMSANRTVTFDLNNADMLFNQSVAINESPQFLDLNLADSDLSNKLGVFWAENDTSDRTLGLQVDGGNRTVRLEASLTVEGDATIDQDLTVDADVQHASLSDINGDQVVGTREAAVGAVQNTTDGALSGHTPTTDTTIADVSTVVTGVDGTGSNAASKADVDTRLSSIKDNFDDIASQLNKLRTDFLDGRSKGNDLVTKLGATSGHGLIGD